MLKLSEIESKLTELPLLPTVVARLLALKPSDDRFFDKVLELAEEDPPFALRIILLSNSASSSPINPITDLSSAVVRMGAQHIASIVTSVAVMRIFMPSTAGERNLWIHAIQVAVSSRHIVRAQTSLNVDPEQAYLCGLLHDIGRFVLLDESPKDLGDVNETNWTTPKQLIETEQELYGFDHAEIGSLVCSKWHLPDVVSNVVKNHHVYKLPAKLSHDKNVADLVRIIQMADFFSVFMILNPDIESWSSPEMEQILNDNCIHPACAEPPISAAQLQNIADVISKESAEIIEGLGLSSDE